MAITGKPCITLCADDYGLAPGVGRAIRSLVAANRLSATSCMTLSPFWPEEAALLRPLGHRVEVGLHLTLTDHPPLGAMPKLAPDGRLPSLPRLMALAYGRRLDAAEVAGEIERQFAAFDLHFGRAPAFIDGHQHVHQLPVIGSLLLEHYQNRWPASANPKPWIRRCTEPLPAIWRRGVSPLKASLISLMGLSQTRRLRRAGIPGNNGFRGVRDFKTSGFASLLESFISPPLEGALIMCHPGYADAILAGADAVVGEREEEYAALAGDALPQALRNAGAKLRLPESVAE
ncbi:MAG: ChbG/HpnK family deacetylase [Magnetococcales bacterium]|nr:ChbG/HpnK family deacetylase [Magnetococcales bacterium]